MTKFLLEALRIFGIIQLLFGFTWGSAKGVSHIQCETPGKWRYVLPVAKPSCEFFKWMGE